MMAKHRSDPERPRSSTPPVKISVLLPTDLNHRIIDIAEQRRISVSLLIRDVLFDHIDKYAPDLGEALTLSRDTEVTLTLNSEIRQLLVMAAQDANLSVESVVQLLLTRHLGSFVQEARIERERAAALLSSRDSGQAQQPEASSPAKRGRRKQPPNDENPHS